METLPAVAKNFYYACKKCETDRYHRVLAHLSTSEARIECEVCGSKKKMSIGNKMAAKKKTTKKKTTSTTKKKTKTSTAKMNSHIEAWNELKERFSDLPPEVYTIRGTFRNDMVIDHPTFGIGIVTESHSHKIEVCFEESFKTLMHRKEA